MYKNHIFDPLNLSSVGEKSAFIEEKKFDFSLHSFKSNILIISFPFNLAIVTICFKYFSIHPCRICGSNLGEIYVVGIYYRINMDL